MIKGYYLEEVPNFSLPITHKEPQLALSAEKCPTAKKTYLEGISIPSGPQSITAGACDV